MARPLDSLLAPVSDDSPTGDDLEYDPQFLELGRVAAHQAERAVGDSVKEAEDPDWSKVAPLAEALLARSKDLRVAAHLTHAWLNADGLSGFADGLGLVRGLLENYWDGVHPQLDAEDDNDPTMRVNSLAGFGNPLGSLAYLRKAPFVQSPRMGRYSLRDLRIANGSLQPAAAEEGEESAASASLTDIEACCMDCDEESLRAAGQAANDASECARAIGALLDAQVGTAAPEFSALFTDLDELKGFLDAQCQQRFGQVAGDTADGAAEQSPVIAGTITPAAATATAVIAGPKDVIRRLDELCRYYRRAEPSSPVPILLRRAKRLVGRNFSDLLQDLAPGGMTEFQAIVGSENSDESDYQETQESYQESSDS